MKHLPSRRFALRDRTAAAHAALDATVGELGTTHAYRRYLRGLHAFRAPAERRLRGTDWQTAAVAPLIEADMADLGVPPPAAAPDIATPADASALAGLAYVLEGSGLGARLLHRQALALALDADHGARHLAAQTASLEPWHAFCARLEALHPFDLDAAAAAACAAFAAAARAFEAADG